MDVLLWKQKKKGILLTTKGGFSQKSIEGSEKIFTYTVAQIGNKKGQGRFESTLALLSRGRLIVS